MKQNLATNKLHNRGYSVFNSWRNILGKFPVAKERSTITVSEWERPTSTNEGKVTGKEMLF